MEEKRRVPRVERVGGYLHRVVPILDISGKVLDYALKPLMVEFRPRDLMQVLIGAAILAVPGAFTEETWRLGETSQPAIAHGSHHHLRLSNRQNLIERGSSQRLPPNWRMASFDLSSELDSHHRALPSNRPHCIEIHWLLTALHMTAEARTAIPIAKSSSSLTFQDGSTITMSTYPSPCIPKM